MARHYSAIASVVLLLVAAAHLLPGVQAGTCTIDTTTSCDQGTCSVNMCSAAQLALGALVKFETIASGTGVVICFDTQPTGTLSLYAKDKTCPNKEPTTKNPTPPVTCPFTYTTLADLILDPCSGSANSNANGNQYGCTATYTAPSSGTGAWTATNQCPLADVQGWDATKDYLTDCVAVRYLAANTNCLEIKQTCTSSMSHISLGDMTCGPCTCPNGEIPGRKRRHHLMF